MKKQSVRRLTLNRETIQRLDAPALRLAAGIVNNSTWDCCPSQGAGCLPPPLPGQAGGTGPKPQ